LEEGSIQGMSGQSTTEDKVKTKTTILKGNTVTPNQQGHNRTPSDHRFQEEEEALEADTTPSQESYSTYFVDKIRGIQQELARLQSKKQKENAEAEVGRNQLKQVLHTSSYYSPYIPEYVRNQQPIQQPSSSVASASHSPARWALPQPPASAPTTSYSQQHQGQF
jgi:type II secretory pathway component PulC